MLTYESIRKILDEEKATGRLIKMPDNFFDQALSYLDKKAKVSEEEWKLDSARRRLQDIIDIREKKIVNAAMNAAKASVSVDNLTPEETEFFNSLLDIIKLFRKKIEKQTDIGQKEEFLVIMEDIPEFAGLENQSYGPFRKGDMTTLPKPIAELLIKKEAAKHMEGGKNQTPPV